MFAFVVPACDREDLVVATSGDAGDTSDSGTACSVDGDCPSDQYCELEKCGVTGTCQLAATCDDLGRLDPVCGCDGITYWNDCLRQNLSVSLKGNGRCGTDDAPAVTCGATPDCAEKGYPLAQCSLRVAGAHTCDSHAEGTCWLVPHCDQVTDGSDLPVFHPCNGTKPAAFCETLCLAIHNGDPVIFDDDCPD